MRVGSYITANWSTAQRDRAVGVIPSSDVQRRISSSWLLAIVRQGDCRAQPDGVLMSFGASFIRITAAIRWL